MTRSQLITAVPTAFDREGRVDTVSTERIFEHALTAGVDAIFVNGTTAEFAALSVAERRSLLDSAVRVAGAERVIAHVGAASPYEAALLTSDAAELGITQLSVLTPFYMPASLDGIRRQIEGVRTSAPGAEVYLYLFPDRTGASVDAADAARLLEEFDLTGAKLSIAGTEYLADVVAALSSPRAVLSGNDGLMREVAAAGGTGVVSGVSSSLPEPFVLLRDAMATGSDAEIEAAAAAVNQIVPVLGPSIAGLKLSLQLQGVIAEAGCRMAIDAPSDDHIDRVRRVLAHHSSGRAPATV